MSDLPRESDVFALASDVGLAIAARPDLDEMLSVIARRVAEALDVWECDIYEYLPEIYLAGRLATGHSGVAVFPHGADTPEDLVGNADAALHKAKRAGKDRVASCG